MYLDPFLANLCKMGQHCNFGAAYSPTRSPTGDDITMKSTISRTAVDPSSKAPNGISGFDEITGGGLPHGRTTLPTGGPGSGKTIFALQFLVHGAQACKEPGIFVAFEETPKRIIANSVDFRREARGLTKKEVVFHGCPARTRPDPIGEFRS